jgi:methionyl-tRNA formyltransferase
MSRAPLRIIFMGTPDFAVPALQLLINGPDRIVAVVSQPDRPKGRGRKLVAPPVKILAMQHNIPVLQPTKIKTDDFFETLKSYRPDLVVVAAYGRILPPQLITLAPHGCINVHGSLLPRHRGAAPIQWAIIDGDKEVGVTIMQMDVGMDTGDILLKRSIISEPDETAGSLFPKIAALGSEALMDTLEMLGNGCLTHSKQDDSLATAAPMLSKTDGLIDWSKPAEDIARLVRGLDPWPNAFCTVNGRKLQLYKPEVVFLGNNHPPGTLLRADREGLLVSTSKACLLIKEVKPEGKKRMTVESFLNGHQLEAGINLNCQAQ